MKAITAGIRILVLILAAAVLFSSCSLVQFPSVNSMIRPPKLTGENALLQKTFDEAVGKDVSLVSPLTGDYRAAFVQFDLDQDGADETLAFYTKNDSPNEGHIHFLQSDGEEWLSVGDITGNGSEVYQVAFYDFDADGGYEIAVSWMVPDSRRNKTLSLYKLDFSAGEPQILQLSVLQIYDYMVGDLDFDGKNELLYLMYNSSDQEQAFKVSLIKMDEISQGFEFVCELPLAYSVNLPVRESADVRGEKYWLYIDCLNYDGSYMTEILYYDTESRIFVRLQDEAGNALSDQTGRNAEVLSEDIDDDGVIEIPVAQFYAENLMIDSEAKEETPLQIITYTYPAEYTLESENISYFYAPDNSFRFRIESFLEDYIVTYDISGSQLRFYMPDDLSTPVFTVTYVSYAAAMSEILVEITEPEVTQLTETYIRTLTEIL